MGKANTKDTKIEVPQDDTLYFRLGVGQALRPGVDVFYNVEKRTYSLMGNTEKHQPFYKDHPETLLTREYPTGYYCRPVNLAMVETEEQAIIREKVAVQQPVDHIEISFKMPPKAEIENALVVAVDEVNAQFQRMRNEAIERGRGHSGKLAHYERCSLTPEECVKAKIAKDPAHTDHRTEITDLHVEAGRAVPRSTIDFPVESKLTVIVDNQYSPYPEDDL